MVYHEELQVDGGAVAIAMANLSDTAANDGLDAEFLMKFADEGLLGGFAGLDLAAGELPFETHGLVGAALADEDFGAAAGLAANWAQNQRGGYQPNRFAARVAVSV
jgi:hypothetical protein